MFDLKKSKIKLGVLLALIFFALTFLFLIAVVIYFNLTNAKYQQLLKKSGGTVKVPEGTLIPSQVLNNKAKYNRQGIVVRGKVFTEPVVCEKKECPASDSCCGCPTERGLSFFDPTAVLTQQAQGKLELLGVNKSRFCQRQPGNCDYHCQDWTLGAVYDVAGVFFSEAPPPGWKLSLDYYFQVESKNLVGTTPFTESATNLFNEIKDTIKNFRTSGSYVLP